MAMMAEQEEPSSAGLVSPRIDVQPSEDGVQSPTFDVRPSLAAQMSHSSEGSPSSSASGFRSPMRQHHRTPSQHREVKETLNAVTEYPDENDESSNHHRINQYIIKDEIGRGSYGAVHLAEDQHGNQYAMKEFSKARLRRRAQSHMLRQGGRPRRFPPGAGINGPGAVYQGGPAPIPFKGPQNDSLHFIREEIAIMKKLNHPNLVQLIEVLDDPEDDSLFMVLEMCNKGVVMKVGLDETAEPFDEETCRYFFRDLILGIEYLHAQGVIHRDIKPDNLLLNEADVLKVVDFGVSEMFEKPNNQMMTAKSAGSPAFLPPELCVVRHGDVSGTAADIWSMGVTLYCLRYGKLPFNHPGVLEMYDSIKTDVPEIPEGENPDFADLMQRILEKDASKRITMLELRDHPWVTRRGEDSLLSAEDNCAEIVDPPNEIELNRAFTRKMNHLLCVMKAIHRFRRVLARHRAKKETGLDSPQEDSSFDPLKARARAEEIEALVEQRRNFIARHAGKQGPEGRGQAHADEYLSDREPLFLGIGSGSAADVKDVRSPGEEEDQPRFVTDAVAESPTATDFNVYDRAYEKEVERIMANPARRPTMFLTKLVEEREKLKQKDHNVVDADGSEGDASRSLADKLAGAANIGGSKEAGSA